MFLSLFYAKISFDLLTLRFMYALISQRLKGRSIGNKHVKITLHEIFMLHIHIMIHIIQL